MGFKIIPVILAGGVGTRLWPLSRETFPKQFLRLVSQYSLLQETVLRVQPLANVGQPLIVCNTDHYFMSQDQLKEINVHSHQFILEPFGRNTAPAIACAAHWVLHNLDDESILLILPSDHYIADQELFFNAVYRAQKIAQQGFLVTFGVAPTHPETGYGYIQAGDPVAADTFKIERFIEKPRLELAEQLIHSGGFYWNSGMFMMQPQLYLTEIQKLAPEIYQLAIASVQQGEQHPDYFRLNKEIFAQCPDQSIDYAVMEKTHKGMIIPLASSWNDLGCWEAVAKAGACDADNNVIRGEVLIQDSQDCFVSSENQMVAILGQKNQIVVTTPDVVLVANKANSQDVKQLVQQLKLHDSHLVARHTKQYDSCGYQENLAIAEHFSVEHFMVKPGMHFNLPVCAYAAQWIAVSGAAEIMINHRRHELKLHHSLYVDRHCEGIIMNNTQQPLHVLRIQLKFTVHEEVSV